MLSAARRSQVFRSLAMVIAGCVTELGDYGELEAEDDTSSPASLRISESMEIRSAFAYPVERETALIQVRPGHGNPYSTPVVLDTRIDPSLRDVVVKVRVRKHDGTTRGRTYRPYFNHAQRSSGRFDLYVYVGYDDQNGPRYGLDLCFWLESRDGVRSRERCIAAPTRAVAGRVTSASRRSVEGWACVLGPEGARPVAPGDLAVTIDPRTYSVRRPEWTVGLPVPAAGRTSAEHACGAGAFGFRGEVGSGDFAYWDLASYAEVAAGGQLGGSRAAPTENSWIPADVVRVLGIYLGAEALPLTPVAIAPQDQPSPIGSPPTVRLHDGAGTEIAKPVKKPGELVSMTAPNQPTVAFSLDVDADGSIGALSDGLLIARYLCGFRGAGLVDGALSPGARRGEGAIDTYLQTFTPELDVDADGAPDCLSDGTIVIRYMFGFAGSALVADVQFAEQARRTSATEISRYLDQRR